jgi:hypothetical protein
VQPVLIDVVHGSTGVAEFVVYEPGVVDGAKHVSLETVDVGALDSGHFVCSVPLRNAGAGLAVITDDPRLDRPSRDGDYMGRLTTQVVPPGEQTRAYFSPGVALDTPEDATLIVKVPYTDAAVRLKLDSRGSCGLRPRSRNAGNIWKVIQVAIRRDGEEEPFVVSAAAV